MTVDQEGFRWRNDDGSETSATWMAAQDTNASLDVDEKARLRVLLNATADPDPAAYTLYYKNTLDSTWLPVQVGPDPWTPADLDLISWWDASDAGTITSSGGLVSQWNDKSGNGLHLAQSDSDDKPATGAVTQNGLNVVNFEYGTWSYLTADAGSDAIDVNPIYMYAAMKIIFTGNVYLGTLGMRVSASASYDSVSPNAVLYGGFGGYQMWTTGVGDVAEYTTQLDAHVAGTGVWRVVRMYMNGGAVGVGIDGGTPNTTTFTLPPSVARYLRMGGRMYTGNPPSEAGAEEGYAPIHVGEMILSHNADDAAAHAYLADKWGITMTGGVVVPRPVYIATSANITASGEDTTAQLSAPAGKTTADFWVGRMWDDENGTDLVDIWSPTALSLLGWWDASNSGSITSSGGTVSQWNDLSGLGRHFVQATSTNRPATGTVTRNGLNTIVFDGADNYMTVDAGSDVIDVNPVTVYTVMRFLFTGSLYNGILSARVSASSLDESSPNWIMLQGGFGIYASYCAGSQTADRDGTSTWRLVRLRFDGTTISVSLDGGSAATVNPGSPPNLVRYLRLAARNASGTPPGTAGFSPLEVAEIIMASDVDDAHASAYLNDKWGF